MNMQNPTGMPKARQLDEKVVPLRRDTGELNERELLEEMDRMLELPDPAIDAAMSEPTEREVAERVASDRVNIEKRIERFTGSYAAAIEQTKLDAEKALAQDNLAIERMEAAAALAIENTGDEVRRLEKMLDEALRRRSTLEERLEREKAVMIVERDERQKKFAALREAYLLARNRLLEA